MNNYNEPRKDVKVKIKEKFQDIEQEKRLKMLNLIAEMITKITLKELYETSN